MRARIQQAKPAATAAGFFGVLPELLALQRDGERCLDEEARKAEKAEQARTRHQAAQHATYGRKREALRAKILDAMRELGPCTVHQLAPRAGVHISRLREHLQAMEVDALVAHSGTRRQFIWRAL